MIAAAILLAFLARALVSQGAAVVVAHHDDEVLSIGGQFGLLSNLHLIHVTDSGHQDPSAWRCVGGDRTAYVEMRARECRSALQRGGWRIARRSEYGVEDQRAVRAILAIADRLTTDLADVDVVFTHTYEGGHPDHDAVACAVQLACARMGSAAPVRIEFPSYHAGPAGRRAGVFHSPEGVTSIPLHGKALARKHAALDQFVSQAKVIRWFPHALEAFRPAPIYDFTQPPAAGVCHYDRFRWALSSAEWRALASEAVRA